MADRRAGMSAPGQGVVAEPSAARPQRPLGAGGHRAGRLPQRGILMDRPVPIVPGGPVP